MFYLERHGILGFGKCRLQSECQGILPPRHPTVKRVRNSFPHLYKLFCLIFLKECLLGHMANSKVDSSFRQFSRGFHMTKYGFSKEKFLPDFPDISFRVVLLIENFKSSIGKIGVGSTPLTISC